MQHKHEAYAINSINQKFQQQAHPKGPAVPAYFYYPIAAAAAICILDILRCSTRVPHLGQPQKTPSYLANIAARDHQQDTFKTFQTSLPR
jgi:hypothetical protein